VSEGSSEIIQPVGPELFHAAGAVHGSVYFKVMDDVAFFAVNSLVTDVFVLTVSFQVYFLRPVASGEIRGVGEVVSRGKTLFIAEAQVLDDEGRTVGRGSGSFIRGKAALGPELGYA
jgi:uncharacterized protein (TIGR00369 family)